MSEVISTSIPVLTTRHTWLLGLKAISFWVGTCDTRGHGPPAQFRNFAVSCELLRRTARFSTDLNAIPEKEKVSRNFLLKKRWYKLSTFDVSRNPRIQRVISNLCCQHKENVLLLLVCRTAATGYFCLSQSFVLVSELSSQLGSFTGRLLEINNQYAIGGASGGMTRGDPDERDRLRALLFGQIVSLESTGKSDGLYFMGAGFVDRESLFIFTTNNSGYAYQKYHGGISTSGIVFEETDNVGPTSEYVAQHWLDDSGVKLEPSIGGYNYYVIGRPWYTYSVNGTNAWHPSASSWLNEPQLTAMMAIKDPSGVVLGVSIAAARVSLLEEGLRSLLLSVSPDSQAFAFNDDGYMVFNTRSNASFEASYVECETGTCKARRALDCPDPITVAVVSEIKNKGLHGMVGHDSAFIFRTNFISLSYLTGIGALPLGSPWMMVSIQPINCPQGFEVNTNTLVCEKCPGQLDSLGGYEPCNICLYNHYYDESLPKDERCQPCPLNTNGDNGAICTSGLSAITSLELLHDNWRISSSSNTLRPCPFSGSCVGGSDFGEGGDGYCAAGYTGVLCATCTQNFFPSPKFGQITVICEQCATKGMNTAIKRIGYFAIAAFVMFVGFMFAIPQMVKCFISRLQANEDTREKSVRDKEMVALTKRAVAYNKARSDMPEFDPEEWVITPTADGIHMLNEATIAKDLALDEPNTLVEQMIWGGVNIELATTVQPVEATANVTTTAMVSPAKVRLFKMGLSSPGMGSQPTFTLGS